MGINTQVMNISNIPLDYKWADYGLRDPSVLTGGDGCAVVEDGKITVYVNGRSTKDGFTRVGRFYLDLDTLMCTYSDFVFSEGDYTAQGSVVKVSDNSYWMFYSPSVHIGFKRAVSANGDTWHTDDNIILRPEQYGCSKIGIPFVTKIAGRWIMVFEGVKKDRYGVFAAESADGNTWHPLRGESIYKPGRGNDVYSQANPSIYSIGNSLLMFYNGNAVKNQWDLWYIYSKSFENYTWHKPNVFLKRSHFNNVRRLEGARLIKTKGDHHKVLFFMLPTYDSYLGGRISIISDFVLKANTG